MFAGLFLAAYLWRSKEDMTALYNLGGLQLLLIFCICILNNITGTIVIQLLLKKLGTKIPFSIMFLLQNTVYLLNYIPMKFGTIFRANYLKKHYGLRYTHFGVFFLYQTILMLLTATVIGAVVLIGFYNLKALETQILLAIFCAGSATCAVAAFFPLPRLKKQIRLSEIINSFIQARHRVVSHKKTIVTSMTLLTINFIFSSVKLGIVYKSMGQDVHWAGCLVLGSLAYSSIIIGLTPGALGLREIVLGAGAVVLGVPLQAGLLAALVDRAIILVYSFTVGGTSGLILWRRSPQDFKDITAGKKQ